MCVLGAWSWGQLYTDWKSWERGRVYVNQLCHYVTTGEESQQAGMSKPEIKRVYDAIGPLMAQ